MKSLYRMRVVNENNISALLDDDLYGNIPSKFNDPYDVVFNYNIEKLYYMINDYSDLDDCLLPTYINHMSKIKMIDTLKIYVNKYNKSTNFNRNDKKAELQSLMIEKLNEDEFKNYMRKNYLKNFSKTVLERIRDEFLISCFTSKVDEEIMWAHYADYSSGYALEYNYHELLDKIKEILDDFTYPNNYDTAGKKLLPKEQEQYNTIYEVKYNNSSRYDATDLIYEIFKNGLAHNDKKNIGKKMRHICINKEKFANFVARKNQVWSYENEYRIVTPFIGKYNQLHIKPIAVYLGEKISRVSEYLIKNICKEKNIKLYKMKTNDENMRLTYVELDYK